MKSPERFAVSVEAGLARIDGDLTVPESAQGLVIFAHGGGSSRLSPRNRRVAEVLQSSHLATLLLDLLTREEDAVDEKTLEHRFDIALLAYRLLAAARFVRSDPRIQKLQLGYFGASTGAAAALAAAAEDHDVAAIVSRGGRPDLAGEALPRVRAPTLLIVGAIDHPQVLDWNRRSLTRLGGYRELEIVPGAGHLFEEPGALDRVIELTRNWFSRYLTKAAAGQQWSSRR